MVAKEKSKIRVLKIFKAAESAPLPLPAFSCRVQAGFPSPADDYIEGQLDINGLVVQRPAATFFVRVEGDSMRDAGISSGDILVVDRSVDACNGKIVVAVVNGEFTVKRFVTSGSKAFLVPENPEYPRLEVDENADFQVWGVVTYVIHKAR